MKTLECARRRKSLRRAEGIKYDASVNKTAEGEGGKAQDQEAVGSQEEDRKR